jgi:hypothetical protein
VTAVVDHLGAYEKRLREKESRQELISAMQRRLRWLPVSPRTQRQYRRLALWWDLEAMRDCPSSDRSREYARNMRWAAEMAWLHGPGTWLELKAKATRSS